jgi:hypothetical protein
MKRSVEWRLQHFSNADISPSKNPGLNLSLFLIGFSVVY